MDVTVVRRGVTKWPRGTDVAMYHVGNNPDAHGWIVDALRRRRGLVVLHEFVLHHLIAGLTLGRGDRTRTERHASRCRCDRTAARARRRRSTAPAHLGRPSSRLSAYDEVLDQADGIVCHSRYVEHQARKKGYEGPIWVVPMPAWPTIDRRERSVPSERFPIVACLGHLNNAKRIPQLLQAFQRLRRSSRRVARTRG